MSTRLFKWLPGRALYWLPSRPLGSSDWVLIEGYDCLDLAAAYGSGAGDELSIDFDLYESLLPVKKGEWSPHNTYRRPPAYLFGTSFPLPTLAIHVADVPLDRLNWLNLFQKILPQYGLRAERYLPALYSPALVLKLGYRLLKATSRLFGIDSPEFALALTFFGIGNLGLINQTLCEVCFRNAVTGLTRCANHSQSKGLLSQREHEDLKKHLSSSRS